MKQLELKRNSGKSLYQQIYTELRAQIFRGDISAGELLPSYRFMSRKYQVNVSTVQKAYDLLETNGYIERRHGSGCFVLPLDSFEFFADGVMLDSVEKGQSESENVIDFATSTPMAGQEETADFIRLINELAEQRPHALFCYPPTRGVPALIEVIHRRLVESGMSVGEENIHIVGGSQQGIDLICKSLINKNTVILTEDPSYSVATNCFQRAGARIETVPMEHDGPDLNAVREKLFKFPIDFYYTMPNFHCPTNVSWSREKRRELLSLAQEYGFVMIEDDCLGELSFHDAEHRAFRWEDTTDSVIYLNSFSKCLVPGLRLGYMLVPGRYEKKLILAKFSTDIASPAILQETLALYIQRGLYDAHLTALRSVYAEKRRCMMNAIQKSRHLSLPYPEHDGGVFFWVRLPEEIDASELWGRLHHQNIKLLPSAVFSHTGLLKNFVRMSYVGCPTDQIGSGITRIDAEIELMQLGNQTKV
jgi:DNA-binding transcriptional MocR family regulator